MKNKIEQNADIPIKSVRGEVMTVMEVAKKLHLSKHWIGSRIRDDTLPFDYFRIEGSLRFDSADIDDYLVIVRFKSKNVQFNPANIEEWFERTVMQLAGIKKIIEQTTNRKLNLRLEEYAEGVPMKK